MWRTHLSFVGWVRKSEELIVNILGEEAREKGWNNPAQLEFEEGIALDNGAQLTTAIAALTVCDAENSIKAAEIAAALSLEAVLGISDVFDESP